MRHGNPSKPLVPPKAACLFLAGLLVSLLFFLAAAPACASRSYSVNRLDIDAEIMPDGSMQVSEHITVDFRGTYSGFFRWINKSPGMAVTGVMVEEDGRAYAFNPGSSYGPAGTFYIAEDPEKFMVDWSFNATDQERRFNLRYRVLNAVVVHNDVAELYYKFLGDESDIPFGLVAVRLLIPPGASGEEVRAWGHGPLHGDVTIASPREITWETSPLPAGTFLEGRVLFPPRLVPEAGLRTDRDALAAILAEEEKWARQANLERALARFDAGAAVVVLLGGLVLNLILYRRFKGLYRSSFVGDYYRELPASYTPAELGVLWHFGHPAPADLTATIIDLARRGYLRIEEFQPEKKGLFKRGREQDYRITRIGSEQGLQAHERSLLDFLFGNVAGGKDAVGFGEIETYVQQNRANKLAFAGFWDKWRTGLNNRGKNQLGFFDPGAIRPKLAQAGTGVLFVLAGIALTAKELMVLTGVALLFAGAALAVTAALMKRRSATGTEDYARWAAFRRFLLHFSEMRRHEIPSLVIWEHYLVYAVTLGVASQVLKQLQLVYPDLAEGTHRFGYGWYHGAAAARPFDGLASALDTMSSNLAGSIKQSMRAAGSSSSSGSGFGGGFSGGGGGGRGGGGMGAR